MNLYTNIVLNPDFFPEGGLNSDCSSGQDSACKSNTGLVCQNYKCVCTSENFWHSTAMTCQISKYITGNNTKTTYGFLHLYRDETLCKTSK